MTDLEGARQWRQWRLWRQRDHRLLWLTLGVLVVLVLVAGVVAGRAGDDGLPLDPGSTAPLGTRGLVVLLEEMGADVEVGALPRTTPAAFANPPGTALLLADDAGEEGEGERAALEDWVRSGGTLVVADPFSPLVGTEVVGSAGLGIGDVEIEGDCSLPSLRDVRRVRLSGASLLRRPRGGVGCLREGDGWFVVARACGRGTIVALGGAGVLTNALLGRADNAVLAVGLLAPRPGTPVRVVSPPAPGAGRARLIDLVPRRVGNAGLQLALAFLLFALGRARRLGRPVVEPQPVALAGSELVVAVGNLLQQAQRRDRAAELLRDDLCRDLARRLGLPADASPEQVVEAAAARLGRAPSQLADLLVPGPAASGSVEATEHDLVALAQSVEAVRQDLARAR